MVRALTLILLRLLAQAIGGMIITAAVAWGIVLYNPKLSPPRSPAMVMTGPDGKAYLYPYREHGFGCETWSISAGAGELPYPRTPGWLAVPPRDQPTASATTTAYGWPLLCMSYRHEYSLAKGPNCWVWLPSANRCFQEPTYRFPLHVLPGRFAANAAIFSLVVGLGWPIPKLARLAVRWRRGCCLACGYDRRGLSHASPCPECGAKPPRGVESGNSQTNH